MNRRDRTRRRFRQWLEEIPWEVIATALMAVFAVVFIAFLVAAVYD